MDLWDRFCRRKVDKLELMVLGREWPLRMRGRGTAAGCSVIGAICTAGAEPIERGVDDWLLVIGEAWWSRGVGSQMGFGWEMMSKRRVDLPVGGDRDIVPSARIEGRRAIIRVDMDGMAEAAADFWALRGILQWSVVIESGAAQGSS